MKTLDIEAVQAFVLTADLHSFTRAAEVLDTTQSAVSVKIKRLEAGLGRKLLERTPRVVKLSADGAAFLSSARALVAAHQTAVGAFAPKTRRLVIGMSHHIVGADLPVLLRRMRQAEPGVALEMRIAASRDVLEAFDLGTVDAAIVLRHDSRRLDGDVILTQSFGWIGASDFEFRPEAPLPIATQPEPCSVRKMAVDALNAAGVSWTEVFVGGGVNTIGAAVAAGLALAALGRRVAPPDTIDLGPRLGLPPLPTRDIVLHSALSDSQAKGVLRTLATALRSSRHPRG